MVAATIATGGGAAVADAAVDVAVDAAAEGAADVAAEGAADAGESLAEEADSAVTCGGASFTAGTQVLLANGKTAPISTLRPGEKVQAADTKTGKNQAETVTAVLLHHDTDLYDLTVKTRHGTEVIHTTSNHLFWDPHLRQWVPAAKLGKGEYLLSLNGRDATVMGGRAPPVTTGWMWDLTVPGNNDHDFYVAPTGNGSTSGTAPVLVHNCGDELKATPGEARDGTTLEDYARLNVRESAADTPDFVTEFTSSKGVRYYGRTELPGEGPFDLQPGSLVDDALRDGAKISCSEVCAALQAQKAEGTMGAYGGTFRTLQLYSKAAQDAKGLPGIQPGSACPSCVTFIRTLGGTMG